MAVKQLQVPANAGPDTQPSSIIPQVDGEGRSSYGAWIDNTILALEAAGWTRSGVDNRNLPRFTEPDLELKSKIERVELPVRDGEPIIVKQLVVPRARWDFQLEEAADIQRRREIDKRKTA